MGAKAGKATVEVGAVTELARRKRRPVVVVVGLSHRTSPVELRERLAVSGDALEATDRALRALPAIEEAAYVSTCNRVEVVAATRDPAACVGQIAGFLQRSAGQEEVLESCLYVHQGREAVRHLFRVAASLDSMVVGEPQILGQIKDAYARAASAGAVGTVLHRCFHRAFSVAKRVRTETGIAARAVSISSAAVELADKIFDRLADKTAMLVGAGKMGELAARHLVSAGTGNLIVTNRTFDRAVDLARAMQATPVRFEAFGRYLALADIVIGSTAAADYVLGPEMVQEALRERKGRPIFCIDLAVPRNFDPRLNDLDNVYLYDIDDLARVAAENLDERAREAEKAEALVEAEAEAFWSWLEHLEVAPTIAALRQRCEEIRRRELERALHLLPDLTERERATIEALTSSIVKKILHEPTARLKSCDPRGETFYLDAIRRLFSLDDPEEK